MKKTIKFRTYVLSQSDKQQIFAYFNKQRKSTPIKNSVLYGGTFGVLHFWR